MIDTSHFHIKTIKQNSYFRFTGKRERSLFS